MKLPVRIRPFDCDIRWIQRWWPRMTTLHGFAAMQRPLARCIQAACLLRPSLDHGNTSDGANIQTVQRIDDETPVCTLFAQRSAAYSRLSGDILSVPVGFKGRAQSARPQNPVRQRFSRNFSLIGMLEQFKQLLRFKKKSSPPRKGGPVGLLFQ